MQVDEVALAAAREIIMVGVDLPGGETQRIARIQVIVAQAAKTIADYPRKALVDAVGEHLAVIDKFPNATRYLPQLEQSIDALRTLTNS